MSYSIPSADAAPATAPAVGGLWLATGESFAGRDLADAAGRYSVVILNAWELEAARQLRRMAPDITLLVYKDLASTRSYAASVDGSEPTGVAHGRADPSWFAVDTDGRRIEWGPYPEHWQMTVWDPGYQRAWTDAVVTEVERNGWDGVFADNDFASLAFYSDAVLAGTADTAGTDRLIRDGLDALITQAGQALTTRGRILVPNISEARLHPGRWRAHTRFGGGMEENFAQYGDGGLLTWHGAQWEEMREVAASGDRLTLLVSSTRHDSARPGAIERTGFSGAALLAGPSTYWMLSDTEDYSEAGWSGFQSLELGAPTGPATLDDRTGVWTRRFRGGWVGLNPTGSDAAVALPRGLRAPDGTPVGRSVDIGAADGVLLIGE